jgi:oxygen-independent coproporphyrinogen III oxidase
MASIYVHVPFCKTLCYYCDFYKIRKTELVPQWVQSLLKEILIQKNFDLQNIETLYFGGGTPSILTISQLKSIVDSLRFSFDLSRLNEFTLEVNPEQITASYIQEIKDLGVNRLSIGIQAFDDNFLRLMNRGHSVQQALESYWIAREQGIVNISIDFIFGLPGMTMDDIRHGIDEIKKLRPEHISAYHLGIEENTVFYKYLQIGRISQLSDDESFRQFEFIHQELSALGYQHYEISNFSLTGKRSQHNSNYWQNVNYLGLGPGAHSFDGVRRFNNLPNVLKYIEFLNDEKLYQETELLDEITRYNELVMVSLRKLEGLDLHLVHESFNSQIINHFQRSLSKAEFSSYYAISNGFLQLNLSGWFVSDSIISEFMFVE